MSVSVRTPAKVNLQLSVGPVRDDGYHELVTVFQALSLEDVVTATEYSGLSLTIAGEGTQTLPVDDTNLAVRAAS